MRIFCWVVLVLFLSFDASAQSLSRQELDVHVEKTLRTFDVPGMAVAIVKDGEVVAAKGFGVREMGESDRVNAHTLFGIASNTKAFTATALGLLVEEGKIDWDAPVIDYLPWFRMSDPFVTREMTVRDLLVHRSGLGLGAGDLLWWPPSRYNRKEIARRLRYIPLSTSFRSAYAYDNVLYGVAGEVIEAVSGLTWEEFIQTRILDRIGMNESNVRHSASGEGGNTAAPHAAIEGVVRPITPFQSDNTNPAGGINASASDIAKWLIVQLDSGRVTLDDRLFSPRTTRELWSIVTPIPSGNAPPGMPALQTKFNGYALGFGIRDYRGYKLVTHTGGLPGYVSRIAMIPALKLGVAVFTNQESGDAFNSVTYWILDQYLGVNDTDWIAAFDSLKHRRARFVQRTMMLATSERNEAIGPSLPIVAYAGIYRDAWYGNVAIEDADGTLRIDFTMTPALKGRMEHWQYDTFVVRWDDRELRADAFITFDLNPDGTIEAVRMAPASPTVDFSYDFQDLDLRPVR